VLQQASHSDRQWLQQQLQQQLPLLAAWMHWAELDNPRARARTGMPHVNGIALLHHLLQDEVMMPCERRTVAE
jgi:aminoglycoside phosphotransferase (APT) family kinase protein